MSALPSPPRVGVHISRLLSHYCLLNHTTFWYWWEWTSVETLNLYVWFIIVGILTVGLQNRNKQEVRTFWAAKRYLNRNFPPPATVVTDNFDLAWDSSLFSQLKLISTFDFRYNRTKAAKLSAALRALTHRPGKLKCSQKHIPNSDQLDNSSSFYFIFTIINAPSGQLFNTETHSNNLTDHYILILGLSTATKTLQFFQTRNDL